MKAPKTLILQFKLDDQISANEFDRLIEIEDALGAALGRNRLGVVDGHDIGSSQMNLFLFVETWERSLWFMEQYLKHQPWGQNCVLAKRLKNEGYEVVWPKNYTGTFSVS